MKPVVIDTNIALDLFVFDDPGCEALDAALSDGRLQWISTQPMRDELVRVLAYPLIAARLARKSRTAEAVVEAFDRRLHRVVEAPECAPLACSDPDDQMFVDLAVAHRARLVSKDLALVSMRKRLIAHGVEVTTAIGLLDVLFIDRDNADIGTRIDASPSPA